MELIAKGRKENQIDGEIFINEICEYFSNFLKKGKLKVKLMNYIPSHILTIIDERIIFATVYSFKRVDPQRPSEMLTAQNDRFLFFLKEFDDLWNDSTNIDLKKFKNL